MIDERIQKIESTIEASRNLPGETKSRAAGARGRTEVRDPTLSETHHEEASSITRFADESTHEAAREEKDPQLAESALQGLRTSIEGLEQSHPTVGRCRQPIRDRALEHGPLGPAPPAASQTQRRYSHEGIAGPFLRPRGA
jgi:hypothetical protein